MTKRYHHMGDVFAAIRNREQSRGTDLKHMISAFRIVRGFAQSFRGRGPFEVDDELIVAWVDNMFEGAGNARDGAVRERP